MYAGLRYSKLSQFPAVPPLPFRRTIRRRELHQIVQLAESTIYEMEKRGEFPRRFRLTARCVVWDLEEVEAWVGARKTASRSGDEKTVPGPDVRRRQYRPVRPTHARRRG
ncbi:helix-turn-helix transcriptional regulator [Salinisphaera sp. RV14]|uniref:helix-turn-helix transcriptional regulator n=1 Tax=Salinisphaera sp. RV14 TaxID=3454140 RepID=UPI003F869C52